jgi:adenylyltransferase/sulfurtransferase
VCGDAPTITELIDYEGFCGLPAREGETPRLGVPVSAFDVHRRRTRGEEMLLLDVRGPDEFQKAHIEGATLIPVDELGDRVEEIAEFRNRVVVVHCHHGPRSRRACQLLQEHGFLRIEELTGGIEAWSITVDPDIPRY